MLSLLSSHRPGPPVPALLREGVSESHVKAYIEQITPVINKGLAVGYRLATGKDPFLTAQVLPTARPLPHSAKRWCLDLAVTLVCLITLSGQLFLAGCSRPVRHQQARRALLCCRVDLRGCGTRSFVILAFAFVLSSSV